MASHHELAFDWSAGKVEWRGSRARLSDREADVLLVLIEAGEAPVPDDAIARKVFGRAAFDADPTGRATDVRAYISRLKRKLAALGHGIEFVHRAGRRVVRA